MFEGMGIKNIVQCEWQSTWPSRHLVYDDSCSSRTSEGLRPRTEPGSLRWRPPSPASLPVGSGHTKTASSTSCCCCSSCNSLIDSAGAAES